MILYVLERKIIGIAFRIQYYGPSWYRKKIYPYVYFYFERPIGWYVDYTDNWPSWVQLGAPISVIFFCAGLIIFMPKIVVIAGPYVLFLFTVFFSPIFKILLLLKWFFYYPILLLSFLHEWIIFLGNSFKWLFNKFMHDGVFASIKYVYFFVKSGIIALYSTLVLSEEGWLHFLVPNIEFLTQCYLVLKYWFNKFSWSLFKYYIYFLILRRFYRWYRYKVPDMNIEWFVDKGPTMLAIYQLRVCPFNEVWALYKEKVYEFFLALFMAIGYIFHLHILAFLKRYVRNVDGCRLTIKKKVKRKLRRPFIRFLVKFHLLFLPFYYLLSHALFFCFTAGRIFYFTFSKTLLVIAVLLFMSFLWINFHKFFFDHFVFFVLNKLGYKFPRSTLYTQPIKNRVGDYLPISRKFKSSLVSLRLSSLVDLKNTNVYSVHSNKLFSQLPYTMYNSCLPKKYIKENLFRMLNLSGRFKVNRYGYTNIIFRDPGVNYKPFKEWHGSSLARNDARFRTLEAYASQHFHLLDKFNFLHYSSLLRYSRLKGSLLLPKFTSNKFDLNTFVLKELLLLSSVSSNSNSSVSEINNGNNLEFFDNSNNLSVPSLSLFKKSDFFLFNKNFNKISSNRKSNLLSDLCYSLMGRYKFPLSKNSTVFCDNPIYRHRTGGNFRYKNVYSYDQRSILNGFRFLNNFKVLASFPRKRIRLYNPYVTKRNCKSGSLLKRHFKFDRLVNKKLYNFLDGGFNISGVFRSTANYLNLMGSKRLIRQFAFLKARDRRRVKFKFMGAVVAPRRGSRRLRKFFYKRFIFNRFNKDFSFYKKRQKVKFSSFAKNPKIAYVIKHNFSATRKRVISPTVISRVVSRRTNNFNFLFFSSKLKSLRRNIIFLLRYRNNRKFFKHGTRFLIRSQLLSKRNQINKGRRVRRFFTRSNIYLSFLKSVYSRNVRLLLAVKAVSSAIADVSGNSDFSYLPLFHVLEKPWWHTTSLKNNKNFSYFNFYSGVRSSSGKLGFTNHNNFGAYSDALRRPRRYLGRCFLTNRLLSRRSYFGKYAWAIRRKATQSPYIFSDWRSWGWNRRFRVKNWFYKNYKIIPSILFINPAKDNRRFAFDYVNKYFSDEYVDLDLRLGFDSTPTFGGLGPLLLRSTFEFKYRYRYFRKLFFITLRSYFNNLYFIFVFCLVFYSFPSDIQPYLF